MKTKPTPRSSDPRAAYLTVDMMKGVFVNGTAAGAGIGRPAAGKTGTTDDFKDAWFVGFTPNLSTAVWIGDDNGRALEYMYGSMQPLSIWRSYMVNAVANLPAVDFVRPSGVEIPPEPKIEQDSDKDKDKDKKTAKTLIKTKTNPQPKKLPKKQPEALSLHPRNQACATVCVKFWKATLPTMPNRL